MLGIICSDDARFDLRPRQRPSPPLRRQDPADAESASKEQDRADLATTRQPLETEAVNSHASPHVAPCGALQSKIGPPTCRCLRSDRREARTARCRWRTSDLRQCRQREGLLSGEPAIEASALADAGRRTPKPARCLRHRLMGGNTERGHRWDSGQVPDMTLRCMPGRRIPSATAKAAAQSVSE
jgi:hypothetical protein